MTMRTRTLPLSLLLVGALTALAGCAPADDDSAGTSASPSASASESADPCAKDSLQTHTPGTLTITTDKPVFEPWFVDDAPENGQGFEGAVAAAIAEQLGFTPDEVTWTRTKFDAAIAPGPKDWDFDINEFSITEERKQAVDFSSPYYDVSQVVVTIGGSKAAKATTLADLKDLKIGAQVGTTSFDSILSAIDPSSKPGVYNDNNDARKALENGQVDAIVVDLPTAFFMAAAQLDNGKVVGQFAAPTGADAEHFSIVLPKGSALTTCVNGAINAITDDGSLAAITKEWLSDKASAPVFTP
jgi:polar amino acid transport system substrate-binding protein